MHEHLPDLLHRMRLEPPADRLQPRRARLAVVAEGAHLDQLVGLERAVDLGAHFVGEALVADDHDGGELVRFGAQLAAAFGEESAASGKYRAMKKSTSSSSSGCGAT
jgi:hypothetical protein